MDSKVTDDTNSISKNDTETVRCHDYDSPEFRARVKQNLLNYWDAQSKESDPKLLRIGKILADTIRYGLPKGVIPGCRDIFITVVGRVDE